MQKQAEIELEEYVNPCNMPMEKMKYYFKPIYVTIKFPKCVKETEFTLDIDFVFMNVEAENVRRYYVYLNDEEIRGFGKKFEEGSKIKVAVRKTDSNKDVIVKLVGYDPRVAYDEKDDVTEIDADEKNVTYEYIIET